MTELKYYSLRREELLDFVTITLILSLLFALLFARFDNPDLFFDVLLKFFIFIVVLLGLRMIVMKSIGVSNGYEVLMRQTYFDRYWFRSYDRLSQVKEGVGHTISDGLRDMGVSRGASNVDYKHSHDSFKGVPMSIVSVFVYLFSLGYLVFPSMWRYHFKRIEHLAFGKFTEQEVLYDWISPFGVTGYRYSKIIFGGFVFYFFFLIGMKYVFALDSSPLYYWYFFIVFWLAVITLLPIPGTEGFDLWYASKFAWVSAMTIVVLGMIAVFIFNSVWYTIFVTIICTIMVLFVYYWRKFMSKEYD